MLRLLKTDYKRIFKDKLFLITCIIGMAFAILGPFLYKLLEMMMFTEEDKEFLGSMFYAKTFFISAFSLSNNFGLIVSILITIVVCKDFSFGTIRNKIISGNKRSQIYLSFFISTASILTGVMFCYSLIAFGMSAIVFPYSPTGFSGGEVGKLLTILLFEIMALLVAGSLLSFLCVSAKNAGISIIIYVAISMILSTVTVILQTFAYDNEALINVMKFVPLFGINLIVNQGEEFVFADYLIAISASALYVFLFSLFGTLIFKKKDLK